MIGNFPTIELQILFGKRLTLNQPGPIEILLQLPELLRCKATETVSRQRVGIHRGLTDQVVANLAYAVGLLLGKTFDCGFYLAQEPIQLKSVRGINSRRLQSLFPVDEFGTKIRRGGLDGGAHDVSLCS